MRAAKVVWEGWKLLGRKIGDFQARVLLFFFYFAVLAPFALVVMMFSDPLGLRPNRAPGWLGCVKANGDPMVEAGRQF